MRTVIQYIFIISLMAQTTSCAAQNNATAHLPERSQYEARYSDSVLNINGVADDAVWEKSNWRPLSHLWLGPEYTAKDFQGRYKIAWGNNKIYVLAEITDDILIDTHRNPLTQYWDDDCLEIFIDEDNSGGDHQYNHNAFAYHMSLDNRAIDIGTDEKARDYSDHVESKWRQHDEKLVWELAIDIYSDDYQDDSESNIPSDLVAGKVLGLMLAYCDNDGSDLRENFIGSESIPFGPKDRGWIDANVFGKVILVD